MRGVDALLAAWMLLGACRTPSSGPDAPAREEPEPASVPATVASPVPSPTTSAPTEAERAAVAAACEEIGVPHRRKSCEASHHFGDFILIEVLWKVADGYGRAWYGIQRSNGAYRLLQTAYDPPGGEEVVYEPDTLCSTDALADGGRPPNTGIIRAEMHDLSLDGRDDLLIECRSDSTRENPPPTGTYLRICLASQRACDGPLWLKKIDRGRLQIDVDVRFVDGWVRRTVRVFESDGYRGDFQLTDTPPAKANF